MDVTFQTLSWIVVGLEILTFLSLGTHALPTTSVFLSNIFIASVLTLLFLGNLALVILHAVFVSLGSVDSSITIGWITFVASLALMLFSIFVVGVKKSFDPTIRQN